jgi:hypothetical protein
MGHPEIKEKVPVRLYRKGEDLLIVDGDRVERGRIPLNRILNLIVESKATLQAYIAKGSLGALRNPGFLGEEPIKLQDRMLLINWRLSNNTLITTVFEYSGFFARFKAEVADRELRSILLEINSDTNLQSIVDNTL